MRKTKMMKALIIVLALVLTVACSANSNSNSTEKTTTANTPKSTEKVGSNEATGKDDIPAKEAPAAFKLVASDHGVPTPNADDSRIVYLEGKTNTDIDIEFLPHGNYVEQLKLMFTGGEFPDVYQSWSGPDMDLVDAGMILSLNDLIDQYGPNLREFIPQAAWDAVTVKGEILAIPEVAQSLAGQVMFIRKDWLDNLNLQVPTTSDELVKVLKAFRDGDPNRNGESDEIPFSMRENVQWGDNIFGMWGIGTAWTEYYHNEEVILGNIHPNILKGLEFIQGLWEEKLIDSEFLTNNRQVWEQKIRAGLVGVWGHTPQLATQWNIDLRESIPDQNPEVIVIPTPRGAGYDGALGTRWSPIGKTFILTKNAKNPKAIIQFFDWLVSEEGQLFTELGIEGDTFFRATANGQITFDEKKAQAISWLNLVLRVHGYNSEMARVKLGDDELFKYMDEAYNVANNEGFPNESIGMPPIQDERNMTTMFREAAAKVMIGHSPLSDYEKFMADWRAQGGDELVKERTDWYNANRK